jgi:hypothetical protein
MEMTTLIQGPEAGYITRVADEARRHTSVVNSKIYFAR